MNNTTKIKSFGIVSLNAEASYFNDLNLTILNDPLYKSFANKFKKLDLIIVGLQEDKKKSKSLEFFQAIFTNHHFIKEKFLNGFGKEGFRGLRLLIFYNKNNNKNNEKLININTVKQCDHSSCFIGRCCNKGLIALKINDLVIMNSHLVFNGSKKEQSFQERICMINNLYNKIKIPLKLNINHNTENIVWFGDLNFRVLSSSTDNTNNINTNNEENLNILSNMTGISIEDLKTQKTKKSSLSKKFNKSLKKYFEKEQLISLENGKDKELKTKCKLPFNIYEAPIKFRPTCKLIKGSSKEYKIFDKGYIRMPSWCDRIIFNKNVRDTYDIKYNSINFPITTDHIGIYGIFTKKN